MCQSNHVIDDVICLAKNTRSFIFALSLLKKRQTGDRIRNETAFIQTSVETVTLET